MPAIPTIRADAYRYPLPPERIAQFPLPVRDASKLLIWRDGTISEDCFSAIATHLSPGSLMVFNNTRVIHARLIFRKSTGAVIEIFCLNPLKPTTDLSLAFAGYSPVVWRCLAGHARRWHQEELSLPLVIDSRVVHLTASGKQPLEDGTFSVTFAWDDPEKTFGEILGIAGKVPLPPYINRETVADDQIRYQTVFARHDGSVAAPTAGLHFTGGSLDELRRTGIATEEITLHVGLGTFRPVTTATVNEHTMHQESFLVSLNSLIKLKEQLNHPLIAVGTTAVRTLESLYWLGVKLAEDLQTPDAVLPQWYPYAFPDSDGIPAHQAIDNLIRWMTRNNREVLPGSTQLMIIPGYRFRVITGMVTNFHQPGSTLLLLVAAFLGPDWERVYRFALDHQFRFLSYGDACLFLRGG